MQSPKSESVYKYEHVAFVTLINPSQYSSNTFGVSLPLKLCTECALPTSLAAVLWSLKGVEEQAVPLPPTQWNVQHLCMICVVLPLYTNLLLFTMRSSQGFLFSAGP